MEADFDLVIRSGRLVDGSGAEPRVADIAVRGDRIVAVGSFPGAGKREIDATGLLVTPGFVDIHTHYDGQVLWADRVLPSSEHGVTTVVVGNCGVGFAPCRPADRDDLIDLMEGVEDIPGVVMTEGLAWDWESFPDYLAAIDARPRDINVAAYLPHSPLRVFAMGKRAADREVATDDDLRLMKQLAVDAIEAGALGFSTSRTLFHRTGKGELIASYGASWGELEAIGNSVRDAGGKMIQVGSSSDESQLDADFEGFARLSRNTGCNVMVSTAQFNTFPQGWRRTLDLMDKYNDDETRVLIQTLPRGIGMMIGLSASTHPFRFCKAYEPLADLPLAERVIELRKPEVRERILAERPEDPDNPLYLMARDFERTFPLASTPNYEPGPEDSVAARAERLGISPPELAYDLMLQDDGQALLYVAVTNYADKNLNFLETLLSHDHAIVGLGDGGAHYGFICDSSYTTFMLTHWARDRNGNRFTLPQVVHMMTQRTAQIVGLNDRGLIAEGYVADINIIDFDRLRLKRPFVVQDLPGGGQRLLQQAEGFVATLVNGRLIVEAGAPTDARPGRLVRGNRSEPVLAGPAPVAA